MVNLLLTDEEVQSIQSAIIVYRQQLDQWPHPSQHNIRENLTSTEDKLHAHRC